MLALRNGTSEMNQSDRAIQRRSAMQAVSGTTDSRQGPRRSRRRHRHLPLRHASAAVAGLLSVGVCAVGAAFTTSSALAVGNYENATIATTALRYVGQWGGNACRDAHKPGDTGGQCREFANCVVWMASDHKQNLSTGNGDYYRPFLSAGGERITNINELVEGDIVQVGEGGHTFIIVKKVSVKANGVGTFNVVDSNHEYNEKVMNYNRTFSLSTETRAYRMGSLPKPSAGAPAPSSPPPPSTSSPSPAVPTPSEVSTPSEASTPTPVPAPSPTYAETPGSVVHTWTDYADAGGSEGPEIPSNDTVQIACKVNGFTVADGNTWWYRIASGPWNNAYYGSADAFYNDGATSGSLLGTPFVDPSVPNC
jgi:hypothetical protein